MQEINVWLALNKSRNLETLAVMLGVIETGKETVAITDYPQHAGKFFVAQGSWHAKFK